MKEPSRKCGQQQLTGRSYEVLTDAADDKDLGRPGIAIPAHQLLPTRHTRVFAGIAGWRALVGSMLVV